MRRVSFMWMCYNRDIKISRERRYERERVVREREKVRRREDERIRECERENWKIWVELENVKENWKNFRERKCVSERKMCEKNVRVRERKCVREREKCMSERERKKMCEKQWLQTKADSSNIDRLLEWFKDWDIQIDKTRGWKD